MLSNKPNSTLCWTEPIFFKLRSITASGWLLRFGGFAILFVIFTGIVEREPLTSPDYRQPALLAFAGLAFFELRACKRQILLSDHDITCLAGWRHRIKVTDLLFGMGVWNRREIKHITLLRPCEPGNAFAFGLMIVALKHARPKQFAIPLAVSLNAVANHWHAIGLDVQLSNWQPGHTNLELSNDEEATSG